MLPALLAGLAAAGIVGTQLVPALVGVFFDDGLYLGLAKSLAEGQGYRHLHLPGAPHAVHYPWGYPAFLALLWRMWPSFPANVVLFKAANAVLVGAFVAVTAAHLGRRLGARRLLTGVVLAAALWVPLVAVATVLFAEPLFLVLAALAILAADGARAVHGRSGLWLAATAGALAGASALTRSVGVAVIAGVALGLWRHRARAALAAAIGLGALVPWMVWVARYRAGIDPALAANYGTYGTFLAQGWDGTVLLGGLAALARPLGAVMLPPLPGWVRVPALALVAGLLVWGVACLVRRVSPLGWTLVAYLALVATWPYGPDRFLWVILPWLAVAGVAGGADLLARLPELTPPRRAAVRAAVALAAALVVAGYSVGQVRGYARGWTTSTQRGIAATMEPIVAWAREGTETTAVIAVEAEPLVWLYTGRRAVPTYLWRARGRGGESLGPDTLHAFLTRAGATHLVLSGRASEAAPDVNALLGRRPSPLRLERLWPGPMYAFRVERTP